MKQQLFECAQPLFADIGFYHSTSMYGGLR